MLDAKFHCKADGVYCGVIGESSYGLLYEGFVCSSMKVSLQVRFCPISLAPG